MSPHTVTTTSSGKTPTAKTNGTINPTPEQKGAGSANLGKKKDGAKGKEIKNEWLTSILNVQKQLTAIATELDEISKEIQDISKAFDTIKKTSQRTEVTEESISDAINDCNNKKEEVKKDSVEAIHKVMFSHYLTLLQDSIKSASIESKNIKILNEKVKIEINNTLTSLEYLQEIPESKADKDLTEKIRKTKERLEALYLSANNLKITKTQT